MVGENTPASPPAVTDHHFSLTLNNGTNKLGDLTAGVLVIRVSIDDYIRAQAQSRVQTTGISPCQTRMPVHLNDMVYAIFQGDIHSIIYAAIINDQDLNGREALDHPRQLSQGIRKGVSFVIQGFE